MARTAPRIRRAVAGAWLALALLAAAAPSAAATPTAAPTRTPAPPAAAAAQRSAPTPTPAAAAKPASPTPTARPPTRTPTAPAARGSATPARTATAPTATPTAAPPTATPTLAPSGQPSPTAGPTPPAPSPIPSGAAPRGPVASPTVPLGLNAAAISPTQGGRLSADGGMLEVTVPPGAVVEAVVVRAAPAAEGGRGRVKIARAFHLTAEDRAGRRVSQFRAPLTIAAGYTPAELKVAGISEASLGIYHLDEVSRVWKRLPSAVDRTTRRVSGPVDHFSVFAVGGETFETSGATGTSFSDNFPDLQAWTTVAGGGSVSGNTLTTTGTGNSRDLFVVTNSEAYTDLTMQVAAASPHANSNNQRFGIVFRYTDANNYYFAWIGEANSSTGNAGIERRLNGTNSSLGSTTLSMSNGNYYWLRIVATGSTLTLSVATDSGGVPGTYTQQVQVTDTQFASGAAGLLSDNRASSSKQANFRSPRIDVTLPQDWSGITQQTGRPGLIWDKVTAAHTGTGSLQLFSGNAGFVGYSAQTTGNAVTGNTRLRVTGWIRTSGVTGGGSNGAKIVVVEQPSGTQTVVATQTGTQGWTEYTGTVSLRADTTSLDTRVVLQGAGKANFDDITVANFLTLTLSTTAAPMGTTISPRAVSSDQAAVGAGYDDGDGGAYYVRGRAAGTYALAVTVDSSRAWTGSVVAAENTGTGGMRISAGSLRWKLGDIADLAAAKVATAFTTTANTTVFDTASSCSLGTTKNNGTCTYNFDYTLHLRWADSAGTFSSVVTYAASQ